MVVDAENAEQIGRKSNRTAVVGAVDQNGRSAAAVVVVDAAVAAADSME